MSLSPDFSGTHFQTHVSIILKAQLKVTGVASPPFALPLVSSLRLKVRHNLCEQEDRD